jgi:hypothetical protein
MTYRVDVLKMGQCQVRGPEVYWMDRWDDWEELYFYMVLVRGGEGRVAVTACCFKYGNVEGNHPLGIMESVQECLEAYERLRKQAAIIIPLYDPEVLQRFPEGEVA